MSRKVKTNLSFAIVFPTKSLNGGYTGPLWITRPSLTRKSKRVDELRVMSVYPVVLATKKTRPKFQWSIEVHTDAPGVPPWMELLPSGFLFTLAGGLRVMESLMKTHSLSYRGQEGFTSVSKTGEDIVSYRLYNVKTGEEILSDILQK